MQLNTTAHQFTSLRPVTDEWLDTAEVAKRLHISTDTVYRVFRLKTDYYQVRRQFRGAGRVSAQGQGHLLNAEDIESIGHIKRTLGVQVMTAAKVFAAQRLGKI